jgi:hypothetical protein
LLIHAAPPGKRRIDSAAVRIFSGIQPTGRKHLGNHIGAVRGYLEGQERGDPAIYCIVDLHATTVAYEPARLRSLLSTAFSSSSTKMSPRSSLAVVDIGVPDDWP